MINLFKRKCKHEEKTACFELRFDQLDKNSDFIYNLYRVDRCKKCCQITKEVFEEQESGWIIKKEFISK